MSDTIDLSKDLEAWYDFSTRYYDSQQNRIQDRSGYGRHADASGGPTVGVEGPNDFEATNFDGTDDYFAVPSGFIDVAGDFTLSCLFRAPSGSSGTIESLVSSDDVDPDHIRLFLDSGDVRFGFGDSVYKLTTTASGSYYDDTYHVVTAVRRGDTAQLYIDGEFASENTNSSIGNTVSNNNPYIGAKRNASQFFSGKIAWVGFHTRALSDPEIEQLTRMTDRMVSKL